MLHERLKEYSKSKRNEDGISNLTGLHLSNNISHGSKIEENKKQSVYSKNVINDDLFKKTECVNNFQILNLKEKELKLNHVLFETINNINKESDNSNDKVNYSNLNNYSKESNLNKFNKRKLISHKYYDILEIRPCSSINEIKKSYRSKVTKLHPDKLRIKNKELKEKNIIEFQEIQKAYELLSNPNKKELYDEYGDDILKYGFFDNWNEMKVLFEVKQKKTFDNNISYDNNYIDKNWFDFWQNILLELFFKPILRKNCIELKDMNQMNINIPIYKKLIENSYKYLRNLNKISNNLFQNPINLKLDNSIINENIQISKNYLFSRLNYQLNKNINVENSNIKSESNINFNNIQIIGKFYQNISNDNISNVDNDIDINIEKINNNCGIIFCENKQGWVELINSAKNYYSDNNYNRSSNFKRKLKFIQNNFNWIILIFLSEEQLPISDQELLLDLYNYKDNKNYESDKISNKEVIESKMDFQSLKLFPCILFKPKNNQLNNEILYSRPIGNQINIIIKSLELLSELDDENFNNKLNISEIIK